MEAFSLSSTDIGDIKNEISNVLTTYPMRGGLFSPVWRTNNTGWYISRFSLWAQSHVNDVTSSMPDYVTASGHFPVLSAAATKFLKMNDEKYSAIEVRVVSLYPNRRVKPHNDGAKFNVEKGGTMDRYFVPIIHPKGADVFVEGKPLELTVGVPAYLAAWKMHHTENNHPSQLRVSLLFDGVFKKE